MPNLYADHAREIAGVGPEYHMASWNHKEATKTKPERLIVVLMTAPLLASGEIAWKYADRATKKTVDMGLADHDRWTLEWERLTGKCRQCSTKHPGQQWDGWNCNTGDRFRTCTRCNGTGKRQNEVAGA